MGLYREKAYVEYNSDIISIDKDLNVTALKRGTTDVCVIPEYDSNARSCLTVNVRLKCKDSYTFKFDGSKEERIVAGIDMCSGTYKKIIYIYLQEFNLSVILYCVTIII